MGESMGCSDAIHSAKRAEAVARLRARWRRRRVMLVMMMRRRKVLAEMKWEMKKTKMQKGKRTRWGRR
jgi:hypothetical protein